MNSFVDYVPFSWAEKYGVIHPLNRREVLFTMCRLVPMSELQILKKWWTIMASR